MTRMDALPAGEAVVVAPMRTFPILRDLVTDVSYNYEVAKRIPPFTPRPKTADEEKAGGYRMAQIDVERSQEFRKCIECFLCQDVCHVIRDHEENKTAFAGPRFFARSAELEMHPLDINDRRELLRTGAGPGQVQHHQVLHRGVPRAHQDHRQRHHPLEGAGGRRLLRPDRLARPQDPQPAASPHGRRGRGHSPATGPAAVQPSPEVHGIPEPEADEPEPYEQPRPAGAHTQVPAPSGGALEPDGPMGPVGAVGPVGPVADPGGPADGGDDAND